MKASIASGVGLTRVYALSTMSVFTNPRGTNCAGSPPTAASPCSVTTRDAGGAIYNGIWLDVSITLPAGYNCTTDRTTYVVRISGDPVRVIA